jgi:hypothetical protein
MPTPEDFNPENSRICWPAILAVFAVQMIVLIILSIAVANHSDFATASLPRPIPPDPRLVGHMPLAERSKAAIVWGLRGVPGEVVCDGASSSHFLAER